MWYQKVFTVTVISTLLGSILSNGLNAAPVVEEQFQDPPGIAAEGLVQGLEGDSGWTQVRSGFVLSEPVFIDIPVSFRGTGMGYISFDLKRKPSDDTDWNTVFALQDAEGKNILRFLIQWNSFLDPSRTGFFIRGGDYYQNSLGLFNPDILMDGEVPPGRWIHVDLFWDDGVKRYGLMVDGVALDVSPRTYDMSSGTLVILPEEERERLNRIEATEGLALQYLARPFSYFLDRAVNVRIGANYQTGKTEASSPLNDAVIDNFVISVDDPPVISSISHDAFQIAGYSGKLVAGETVTVTLQAPAGGKAVFDIGERMLGLPMTEDEAAPGTYTGSYTVRPGDLAEAADITAGYTDYMGFEAQPRKTASPVSIDGTTHITVSASNDLVPADESARSGLTVVATDANGKAVRDHQLKMTLSTTDEYTGTVGGGSFEDTVGGTIDVDWGGVTDSFGEVTAQYVSGFAAKTILVSAKDMVSGDVGIGWVRSFIEGTVDIVVTEPKVSTLSVAGTMDISLSRDWLTADGQSRSRITAVVKDASGEPMSGHNVQFTLLGDNGAIRVVQGKTDSRGRAIADYIAGTVMGQVQVEVRDLTSGLTAIVSIELRPDAPAEITLTADPAEIVTGGETTVTAKVTDVNKNPNRNVDVIYNILVGDGTLGADQIATDEKGNASVTFTAGDSPGLVTLRGTVISREPTAEEISTAKGAVFLFGLEEDPGRLEVVEWLAEPGDEVTEGQPLVTLEDRADTVYTVVAPRDGILATFVAEERDRVEYGDTLGYVNEVAE